MQINNIIHMMYDNKYHYDEPIIAQCNLTSENIIANGKIEVKRDLDTLHFIVESWEYKNKTEVSGKGNSQVIKIPSETIPINFKCEITNFPLENRTNDFKGKDILVKLHKILVTSDFTIDMEKDKSFFECDLLPLYDSGELGELCVI